MRWTAWLAILVLGLASVAGAQDPAPIPSPEPAVDAPAAVPTPKPDERDEYRVGNGDVVEVTVFGHTDLSRSAAVRTDGTIYLPLLGDVPVAGLSITEIRAKVAELLERDFLVDPKVEARVLEFNSQFVTVLGEVNSPGRKALRGQTRLIDALVESGGFRPSASGEVVITRRSGAFDDGNSSLSFRIGSGVPTVQEQVNLEVRLRSGDMVFVAPKQFVTVEGEVARPSRYVLEGDLTVSGLIALAGGLTRFGSDTVELRRVDPVTQESTTQQVSLKDIRKGKKPDVALQPKDVIHVPRRGIL